METTGNNVDSKEDDDSTVAVSTNDSSASKTSLAKLGEKFVAIFKNASPEIKQDVLLFSKAEVKDFVSKHTEEEVNRLKATTTSTREFVKQVTDMFISECKIDLSTQEGYREYHAVALIAQELANDPE
jgi:hypothetical protein